MPMFSCTGDMWKGWQWQCRWQQLSAQGHHTVIPAAVLPKFLPSYHCAWGCSCPHFSNHKIAILCWKKEVRAMRSKRSQCCISESFNQLQVTRTPQEKPNPYSSYLAFQYAAFFFLSPWGAAKGSHFYFIEQKKKPREMNDLSDSLSTTLRPQWFISKQFLFFEKDAALPRAMCLCSSDLTALLKCDHPYQHCCSFHVYTYFFKPEHSIPNAIYEHLTNKSQNCICIKTKVFFLPASTQSNFWVKLV